MIHNSGQINTHTQRERERVVWKILGQLIFLLCSLTELFIDGAIHRLSEKGELCVS